VSAFDELFAGGAGWSLMDVHGELVTFLPDKGKQRPITVIPVRGPMLGMEPPAGGVHRPLVVRVMQDPDDPEWGGIDPAKLELGKDRIRMAWRRGDAPQDYMVMDRLGQVAGMIELELAG